MSRNSGWRLLQIGLFCWLLGTSADGIVLAHGDHGADDPLSAVAFEQRLDEQVPLDLSFRDEVDQPVRLDDYLRDKPAILMLNYYACDMLCSLALPELVSNVGKLDGLKAGTDFDVVLVSIDPNETSADAAERKIQFLPKDAGGWHFLTGQLPAIDSLANAVGFHYAYDSEQGEFAHPSGIVFLTPGGQIARYIYGIDYDPDTIRLNLIEASKGRIGSPVEQLLLSCYHYNPVTGRYTFAIEALLRIAGTATAGVLGIAIFGLVRRSKHAEVVD